MRDNIIAQNQSTKRKNFKQGIKIVQVNKRCQIHKAAAAGTPLVRTRRIISETTFKQGEGGGRREQREDRRLK